jgi:DNA-binding MarR family transcriptional regulator
MDGGELHRLGKRLLELSRAVTAQPGDPRLTPGELAVLEDVLRNPDSSVVDIQIRSGFAQSHVSASVARLRERQLVETRPDPTDGRRIRIRVSRRAARAISRRARRPVDDVLIEATGSAARARRAAHLLDELIALLD